MKKHLNLGCGSHYLATEEWTNLDFISNHKSVIAYNLLRGIPLNNNEFDLVYHSHVLEHFSKGDGLKLIKECFRVLKTGGIIRIAIPNLEEIALNYIKQLNNAWDNPNDNSLRSNYNWMLIEMFDQTVRNNSGGEMLRYLSEDNLINEDFIYERIGEEGRSIRTNILQNKKEILQKGKPALMVRIKQLIKTGAKRLIKTDGKYKKIGRFRLGGEIHQWMYDRYSLRDLLTEVGFVDFKIRDAFTSYNPDWESFNLDGKDGITRKADSLFVEAKKL